MEFKVLAIPELPAVLIVLVSVFILYLILRRFLYTPVTEFLAERQKGIQSDIDSAAVSREEAEELKIEYEKRLASSEAEGQEIIENSRRRGAEIKEGILDEAREEAQIIIARAKKEIQREKEKAYEDVKDSAGQLALLIASKLMEEEMDKGKQEQLINQFIDEVGSSKWQN